MVDEARNGIKTAAVFLVGLLAGSGLLYAATRVGAVPGLSTSDVAGDMAEVLNRIGEPSSTLFGVLGQQSEALDDLQAEVQVGGLAIDALMFELQNIRNRLGWIEATLEGKPDIRYLQWSGDVRESSPGVPIGSNFHFDITCSENFLVHAVYAKFDLKTPIEYFHISYDPPQILRPGEGFWRIRAHGVPFLPFFVTDGYELLSYLEVDKPVGGQADDLFRIWGVAHEVEVGVVTLRLAAVVETAQSATCIIDPLFLG